MNRFVKIEGHNNWFLCIDSPEDVPESLNNQAEDRLSRMLANKTVKGDGFESENAFRKLESLLANGVDYVRIAQKYDVTVLVRPIGSFMTLHHTNKIVAEKYAIDFPVDERANILICENDETCEPEWLAYLQERFPNEEIAAINFFSTRSEESVREFFKAAEIITFSTTFTSFDWYRKLANCLHGHNKVIGYSHDPNAWFQARGICAAEETDLKINLRQYRK